MVMKAGSTILIPKIMTNQRMASRNASKEDSRIVPLANKLTRTVFWDNGKIKL
jgi:hypothetical protein